MLLRVRELKTYFHTKEGPAQAVDRVSFEIAEGETFCLVGESGCGKSVTALSIIQLIPQPSGYYAGGSIEYKGRDIVRLPEFEKRKFRGSEISMIFQEPMTSLNPVLTVGFQLMEPVSRRNPSLDNLQSPSPLLPGREGLKESDGIGVGRVVKDPLPGGCFHNAAGIHDGYSIRAFGDNPQVMGDEQYGGSFSLLEGSH